MSSSPSHSYVSDTLARFRLLFLSAVGIFFFFIPLTMDGVSTIPLDHLVSQIKTWLGGGVVWYAFIMIVIGAIFPFFTGQWSKSMTDKTFSVLKVVGAVTAFMAVTGWGPEFLHSPDMLPFLFEKLVISVGLIVPIGAIFLSFLVGYGLLELVGIIVQPIMRPIWRTPGRSAIDAVASFVGSYSLGLLITNRVYKAGQYSAKEAAIIATGFSTVSATFMIIVAKTLDIMSVWNLYFWGTLVITFVVTAITAHLPPLLNMDNSVADPEPDAGQDGRLLMAYQTGMDVARRAPTVKDNVVSTIKDGLVMTIAILPSIMSVGLIGLLVAKYTPLFEWLGYLFYPFTAVWGIDGARELAQAAASGLAEMFLPALLLRDAEFVVRMAASVVCVSSVLFFSASIPCILSTSIPLSVGRLVIIWFIRTALSLLLAIPFAMFIATQVS